MGTVYEALVDDEFDYHRADLLTDDNDFVIVTDTVDDQPLYIFLDAEIVPGATLSLDSLLALRQPVPFWKEATATARGSWDILDRAHSGFWDDSPIVEISVTPVQTPTTVDLFTRFDVSTLASGFGATATATMQATSCLILGDLVNTVPVTGTSTFSITAGLDGRLVKISQFANLVVFNAFLQDLPTVSHCGWVDFGAILKAARTANFDGSLSRTISAVSSYDAMLLSSAVTLKTAGFNSILSALATTTTKTLTLNAELLRNSTSSAGFDGALSRTGAKPLGLDATILQIIQSTDASSFDALLVKTITQDIIAIDSVFQKTLAFNIPVGFNAVLFRSLHPFIQLEAFLNLSFANTGADAVLISGTSIGTTTLAAGMDAITQGFPVPTTVDAIVAGGRKGFFFLL